MAERKSPVMAIIGKDGPQEYETGDGLPLDLGGGGGSASLYIHHVYFETNTHYGALEYISTNNEPLTKFLDLRNGKFIFLPQNSYIEQKTGSSAASVLFNVAINDAILPPSIYAYAMRPVNYSIERFYLNSYDVTIKKDTVTKYI